MRRERKTVGGSSGFERGIGKEFEGCLLDKWGSEKGRKGWISLRR